VSLVVAILTLVLLAVVLLVVSAPLRAAQRRRRESSADAPAEPDRGGEDLEREELEAAREAKYREIRDAELDYRTGKLSREDYESIDRDLRAEAIEILNRLETSAG
jgi:flagellar biosynthesis/type III secretory pathway M-ring protein FliF/YscJ